MQIIGGYLILNNGMRVKLPSSAIDVDELFDTNMLNRVLVNYEMKDGKTFIYITTIDALNYIFKPIVKKSGVGNKYETVDGKYSINVERHKGHYVIVIEDKQNNISKEIKEESSNDKEAPVEKEVETSEPKQEDVNEKTSETKNKSTKKSSSKKKKSTRKKKTSSTSKKK